MKKLFTILSAIIITVTVWAQSPQKMSYQAVIRNSSDQLVTSQPVGMQISILQGTANGTAVYTETQTPTTNANGLVSIEIGGEAGFDAIDWANGPYFIKTETDPTGGTAYSISGTSELLSVPYALFSANSIPGPQGPIGLTGDQGIQGEKGLKGDKGDQGIQGIQGEKGLTGDQGLKGDQGIQGENGLTGDQGLKGDQGIQGEKGLAGDQGLKGEQGIQGEKGLTGDKGEQGIQGVQGEKGFTGDQGLKGDQGIQGEKGLTGDQGLKGDKGDPGTNGANGLTTSVNGVTQVNGSITLTKSDIGLGNVDNTTDVNKTVSNATQTALNLKVDKVTGKGLSTNDFKNTDSVKLASIATGAEVNVNADWNSTSGDAQIVNKPTTIAGYGITDAVSSTGNQTITGDKAFTGTIAAANQTLSGKLGITGNVAIGTPTPEASAVLDVSSTSQGFLPPRMTYEQKLAIVSPVAGLLIWCSNCGASGEIQVYNGTTWTNIIGGISSASLPILAPTTAISSITATTATSGGNVTNDGGGEVTIRGVCWSTSANPTIADNKTTDGTGTGEFASSITGLSASNTYFVRAYATNSTGTAYGSEINFYLLPSVEINGTLFVHPIRYSSPWGAYNVTVGSNSPSDGKANTQLIVQTLGIGNYAAYKCDTLSAYGYDDWYLPSLDELTAMWGKRIEIGGFSTVSYWTSTECTGGGSSTLAYDIKFNNTLTVYTYYKNDSGIGVRCVRRDD